MCVCRAGAGVIQGSEHRSRKLREGGAAWSRPTPWSPEHLALGCTTSHNTPSSQSRRSAGGAGVSSALGDWVWRGSVRSGEARAPESQELCALCTPPPSLLHNIHILGPATGALQRLESPHGTAGVRTEQSHAQWSLPKGAQQAVVQCPKAGAVGGPKLVVMGGGTGDPQQATLGEGGG